MADVWAVLGPPGTGKTSYGARQAKTASRKYGPGGVLVSSLTRAAAAEIGGRDTGLDPDQIGTTHAHCHRGLGRPKIVEARHLKEWSDLYPEFAMRGTSRTDIDADSNLAVVNEDGAPSGDALMQAVDCLRAQCAPVEQWDMLQRDFFSRWQRFKEERELMDFTDLLETALARMPSHPSDPGAIIVDEGQDHSLLEKRVIMQWADAPSVETLVWIGDTDQSLFSWRGADRNILSVPNQRVLRQSYRVPRAVHELAMQIIGRASRPAPAEYLPRDADGDVSVMNDASWKFSRGAVDLATELEREGTVMLLASCGYMLAPVVAELRRRGIPYHNPLTERWNPLRRGVGGTVSAILSYRRPWTEEAHWSLRDVLAWSSVLKRSEVFHRGAVKALEGMDPDIPPAELAKVLAQIMPQEVRDELRTGDVHALRRHAKAANVRALEYACKVVDERGEGALTDEPRIIVGTIHSVKGGQADSVILFPDVSPQSKRLMATPGWDGVDSVHRMFYVALTRARQRLVVCASADPAMRYPIP